MCLKAGKLNANPTLMGRVFELKEHPHVLYQDDDTLGAEETGTWLVQTRGCNCL